MNIEMRNLSDFVAVAEDESFAAGRGISLCPAASETPTARRTGSGTSSVPSWPAGGRCGQQLIGMASQLAGVALGSGGWGDVVAPGVGGLEFEDLAGAVDGEQRAELSHVASQRDIGEDLG